MKIATFNINGVRARLPRILAWLQSREPDVALLQEIKCQDQIFPRTPFEDLGYNVTTHGQKSFNGVAILSKFPLENPHTGLKGDDDDTQARWIEAVVGHRRAVRVCCLYLPNGNPAPSPKYDYKLAWMERLRSRMAELLVLEEPTVVAGDFNVIPQPEDAANPDRWKDDALYLPDTRAAWRWLLNMGYTDAFRAVHPTARAFTFWDFQRRAWQRDDGIRIDHLLLTPQCADLLQDCRIDKDERAQLKPSDHVPIWIEIDA